MEEDFLYYHNYISRCCKSPITEELRCSACQEEVETEQCPHCQWGRVWVPNVFTEGGIFGGYYLPCPDCRGTGWIPHYSLQIDEKQKDG